VGRFDILPPRQRGKPTRVLRDPPPRLAWGWYPRWPAIAQNFAQLLVSALLAGDASVVKAQPRFTQRR
jgi:hypothetical protein